MTSRETQLDRIERLLAALVGRGQPQAWYSVTEFARLVGRSAFTCREWCRLGRIVARKKASGRGAHPAWAISHEEYERFQREGLLTSQTGFVRAATADDKSILPGTPSEREGWP